MADRGRACPLFYRYQPEDLARPATLSASTLYVVGCLYGNTAALDVILERAAIEDATLIFNGDFHWLDTDPADFRRIAATAAEHPAIQGNVEPELISGDDNGCGCAYPDYIDDTTVELSNSIAAALARTASRLPDAVDPLRGLPRFLVAEVAGHRIAVLHGDPESLAGWRLALEAMEPADPGVRGPAPWAGTPTSADQVAAWLARAQVTAFASTHTGLPFAQDYDLPAGRGLVINNGRGGMPNFAGTTYGVATRLSADPTPPADALYGIALDGLRADAVPITYDTDHWQRRFLAQWPPGSAAHTAYNELRRHGPALTIDQATRGTISSC